MIFEEIFQGSETGHGYLNGYKSDGKKDGKWRHQKINYEEHFKVNPKGLSPVNERKRACLFICGDVDEEIDPKKFCAQVWKIDSELFVFKSLGNRWHVYKFFDDWVDAYEARKLAEDLEKELMKLSDEVDTGHTLPHYFSLEKNKPGYWIFLPYHKDQCKCYSPRGNPLTKEQFEFRHTWRKHPLISGSVGMVEEGEGKGKLSRHKALFNIAVYLHHKKIKLTIKEVNNNLANPISDTETYFKHLANQVVKPDYDEEHLKNNFDNYLKEITGVETEGKANGVLEDFIDEDLEKKQEEFFKDTIYIKLDDRWYSKKTGKEYKEKTIKVVNGHLFPDVVKAFAKDEERKQEVEMGVYRPDLYKSKEDPVVIDEEGLNQLNTYRPGGVKPMEADTPQRKKELELFKELIRKLTENENVGFTDTKEERPLYDYFLDHLSMPFQRPGEKVRSSIVMHSFRNQIGKSTVFEIEKQGLGKDNCIVITPENAIRREKAFLPNQLVLIDELLIDGDYKKKIAVLNILKPLMTADEHDCRPLFKESRQIHSRCSFMCFTNHKDAVAIKEFDARYTCIDVNKTREEMGGDKFFNQIWNQNGTLKGTIANVAKHFLSTRKISENFDPAGISLDTKFRKIMSEQGGHPLFPVVQQKYREGDTPFDRSVISISESYFYLKNEEKLKGSLNELSDCLETLKCQKLGEVKHRNSGKTPTLYITKNFEFFEGMTKAEIANNYWLPIECGAQCVSSEKYNLSQADILILREKQEEITAFEKMMDKEPEDPDVIEIDDLKDIPEEIKKRERDINEK